MKKKLLKIKILFPCLMKNKKDNFMNEEITMPIKVDQILEGYDKRKRREKDWYGIIIHHTGVGNRKNISKSLWQKLNKNIANFLAKKDNIYVSAHYQISRDGKIIQIINPEYYEAFHAGKSSYYHPIYKTTKQDWNRYSIGIELLGDGNLHKYSRSQYNSLAKLTKDLINIYDIDPSLIRGHYHISPGRKPDPGSLFDWNYFYSLIFSS